MINFYDIYRRPAGLISFFIFCSHKQSNLPFRKIMRIISKT
ncbi:hypothetical protein CSC18_1148 [Klebsiella aerogenes]|nr:hypothetical protein CSC18_1148 [Klebsiella aerogenes]